MVFTDDVIRQLRGQRVAVVGNATPPGALGCEIDGHDVVVRFNNYRTAGFEALVGVRCNIRVLTGWLDVEHREDRCLEVSPFLAAAPESANLERFNADNVRPVLAAEIDVHPALPMARPSTGLAFVTLCRLLGVMPALFNFDGFRSPHYWEGQSEYFTTHGPEEHLFLYGVRRYAVGPRW